MNQRARVRVVSEPRRPLLVHWSVRRGAGRAPGLGIEALGRWAGRVLEDVVGDVVVGDVRLAADEVAPILGIENGGFDVLASEGADRIDAVPKRQGDELAGALGVAA